MFREKNEESSYFYNPEKDPYLNNSSSNEDRKNFIIKVYTLVFLILILSACAVALPMTHPDAKQWISD